MKNIARKIGYKLGDAVYELGVLIGKIISPFSKKPKHHHYWLEYGLTDECEYGCKIMQCDCGETMVSHRRIYGCPLDKPPVVVADPQPGCRMMDVTEL